MTIVTASILHYVKGYTVAIIDCDFPIRSVVRVRDRELKVIDQSLVHQQMMSEQFKATGQKIYPVIPSSPAEAFNDLQGFLKHDERHFDIVIFDLPGTTNTPGVLSTMACLDHIFIPISPDNLVMESTLLLVNILHESIIGRKEHALQGAYLFWTKMDKRVKTLVYDRYNDVMEHFGLSRLQTRIPARSKFDKEISAEEPIPYRTTLFAPERKFITEAGLVALVDEICGIIKLG